MEHSPGQHERDLCDEGTILYLDGMGFPGGSDSKESTCNVGDLGLTPRLGRCPESWQPTPVFNPGEPHAQRSLVATVHGVSKSRT